MDSLVNRRDRSSIPQFIQQRLSLSQITRVEALVGTTGRPEPNVSPLGAAYPDPLEADKAHGGTKFSAPATIADIGFAVAIPDTGVPFVKRHLEL